MKTKKTRKTRTFEGLPVVDAKDDIVLNVSKHDVQISKKKDPAHCAAAEAGKRELKCEVKVYLSRMYVKTGKQWVRYVTPSNVSREIVSFDRGNQFEPGSYVFKAASISQRLGAHKGNNLKKTG